jgi:hypothetical protein
VRVDAGGTARPRDVAPSPPRRTNPGRGPAPVGDDVSSLNTGVVGLDSCVRQVEHDGGPAEDGAAGAARRPAVLDGVSRRP